MPENGVAALARKKWQSSGLTDAHAKALKFKALSKEETKKLAANFNPVGALFIPYFTADGKPSKFFRIRYLEDMPGFTLAKPQRYAQPAKTLNEVYLPPLMKRPWSEILKDATAHVCITEGELKAAAATAAGFPTIGLGGVDCWRSQKRGIDFLPQLADAEWTGRRVTIVYDSDAATNPDVVRAQDQLARELTARGALPDVVSLPPAAGGGKQGLDDYLLASGAAEFKALLDKAEGYEMTGALWAMSEEVVYVKDPGVVIVRDTGQHISPANFVQHAYANRVFTDNSGDKPKKRKTAQAWLEWPSRFELNSITYAPGKPQIFDGQWNMWRGWGCEPVKGDIRPWVELLDYVFKGQAEARKWFERWCAYPLQHPGAKLFTSVIIWSTHHGTGKTLIGYTLRNIYGKNAVEVTDEDLHSTFNEWAQHRQFVIGDEITGSDKRADADRLKRLITQEFMRINVKYLPSYFIPDCINYYLTSNNPAALFMEDTDRRSFVHEIIGAPMPLPFYKGYDAWLKGGGAAALFHYLLNLDLGDWDPLAPAMVTSSKRQMIVDNKSDLGSWVLGLKEEPEAALRVLGDAASAKAELASSHTLLRCYDPALSGKVTANGLGRELKRAGLRQVNDGLPIRTVHGLQRLWAIRNAEKWMSAKPAEITQHYNATFGTGSKF